MTALRFIVLAVVLVCSSVSAFAANALDTSGLTWTTGGAGNWTEQSAVTHDGVDAAQSGVIGGEQSTWMKTTVTGPTTLSFWWKVSSEPDYDCLRFYIDGTEYGDKICGDVDWTQVNDIIIPAGSYTLIWEYSKDKYLDTGYDAAWVDQVELQQYTVTPSAGANGSISPNTQLKVAKDATTTVTITPNNGYSVVTPIGGTCPQGTLDGTTYSTGPIIANCTVAPTFVASSPGSISGTIVDATNNQGISGAKVNLSGSATPTYTTDNSGNFTITGLIAASYSLTSSANGFITDSKLVSVPPGGTATPNIPLSPVMSSGEYRVVLSWGAAPADLDLHAYVPTGNGCYEVDYSDPGSETTTPYTFLSVDDTTSYGPETITIKQQMAGTYQFWVKNYSTTPDFTTSEATVTLYNGAALVRTFNMPAKPTGSLGWHVFDIIPTTGQVITVNTLASVVSGSCTNGVAAVNLSVNLSGNGSVNSNPSGIACATGSSSLCSAQFDPSSVTVTLTPFGSNSTFTGWSGACTNSSGPCTITIGAPKSVTAIFTDNPAKVKISSVSTNFYTLDSALDAVTTPGKTVTARDQVFTENVIMTSPVSIFLKGGYTDNAFTVRSTTSTTIIDGSLKIRSGTLKVESLKVR